MAKISISKLHTLLGHKDCVYSLESTNKPHLFFSAAGDGMVAMWDLNEPENGQLIAKVQASVYALCYHHERDILVIGQNFDGIHVIDIKSKKVLGSLNLTSAAIFDIKRVNEDLYIATGDGYLIHVDLDKLSIRNKVKLSDKSLRSLAYSDKHNELAVGASDGLIRVIDPASLRVKQAIDGHTNSVFTVVYSPDEKYLLSGSRDAHLKIWHAGNGYGLNADIVAHMYTINHICYSPDGNYFVTCSMDKSIKVWQSDTFKLLKVIDKARHAGHGTSVNKLLWVSYQNQLISASDDRTISIWDLQNNI
jgi:WD40 repeat protein